MIIDKRQTITAHCIVKNEENWVWYAINSVLEFVDKILVFDTGSTDNTLKIIKSIKSPKIFFEEKGDVDSKGLADLRQEMIDRTGTDWFMVLDGDEVWLEEAIREAVNTARGANVHTHSIVVPHWICFGDVFHYSKELTQVNNYPAPKGFMGFRMTRLIRKLDGIHCIGLYPDESFADKNGINVSNWDNKRRAFLPDEYKYFHMSFLPRSSSRKKDKDVMRRGAKTRFTKGAPFPENMVYPEVFYKKRPSFVPSPWRKITLMNQIKGLYYRAENFKERRWS